MHTVINNLEKYLYTSKNDHQSSLFMGFFNKVALRISYYFTPPKYFVPKTNVRNETHQSIRQNGPKFFDFVATDIFSSEVKKIISKVNLRYLSSQQILLTELVNQVILENPSQLKLNRYKWVSPLMPIIHLANDPVEKVEIDKGGGFHMDRDASFGIQGSGIVWMPFTNYEYVGIATKSFLIRILTHFLGPRFGKKNYRQS